MPGFHPMTAAAVVLIAGCRGPFESGLVNFGKVSDDLYRGAQPSYQAFKTVQTFGVVTDVDLRFDQNDFAELEDEGRRARERPGVNRPEHHHPPGMQYVRIRCKPWDPRDEDVVKFLSLFRQKDNNAVFVHCHNGADRTGYMVASYRIVEQGWDPEEAIAELRQYRFWRGWHEVPIYLRSLRGGHLAEVRRKVAATSEHVIKVSPTGPVAGAPPPPGPPPPPPPELTSRARRSTP